MQAKPLPLRAIARAAQPAVSSGEIWLNGQPLHTMKAFEAARVGVQLVCEDRRIIPGVTVEENLILAQIAQATGLDS